MKHRRSESLQETGNDNACQRQLSQLACASRLNVSPFSFSPIKTSSGENSGRHCGAASRHDVQVFPKLKYSAILSTICQDEDTRVSSVGFLSSCYTGVKLAQRVKPLPVRSVKVNQVPWHTKTKISCKGLFIG